MDGPSITWFNLALGDDDSRLCLLFDRPDRQLAYLLSLCIFAVGYGYIAAYDPQVEDLLIALLDILQSIPVLSFLPGVMLAVV